MREEGGVRGMRRSRTSNRMKAQGIGTIAFASAFASLSAFAITNAGNHICLYTEQHLVLIWFFFLHS